MTVLRPVEVDINCCALKPGLNLDLNLQPHSQLREWGVPLMINSFLISVLLDFASSPVLSYYIIISLINFLERRAYKEFSKNEKELGMYV